MSRLLAAITLLLSIALTILVTIICSVPIIIAGLIKLLVPIPAVWRSISVFCNFMMYCWCEGLALLLHLNPWLKWDVQGIEGVQEVRANSGRSDSSQKHEAAPRPASLARRLKQQVRDEAVRGTVRTESTAQLELTLR